MPGCADKRQGGSQLRMRIIGRKMIIPGPAFRIKPIRNGDSLKQGALSGTVLAGKKGHRGMKTKRLDASDGRNPVEITVSRYFLPVNGKLPDGQRCVSHAGTSNLLFSGTAGEILRLFTDTGALRQMEQCQMPCSFAQFWQCRYWRFPAIKVHLCLTQSTLLSGSAGVLNT